MSAGRMTRLIAFAGLGGACLLSSLAALVSLNAGGAIRLGSLDLMPIAAGYDRRAQGETAPPEAPPPMVRSEAASRSRGAIGQYPYDTAAWLQLAYLDTLEHGQLTSAGVADLRRSYDLVAVDPDFAIWRITFALEHSQALPTPMLTTVGKEVEAVWTAGRYRAQLLNLRSQLQNPAGRLALFLWINDLQADRAK